jgi:peroxiredoxin
MTDSTRPILISVLITVAILIAAAAFVWWPKGDDTGGDIAPGTYRLLLAYPSGELPVGLELAEVDGKLAATLINGSNRVKAEATAQDGDLLTISFPSYDSTIELSPQGDGLAGTAHLRRRSGPVDVAARAVPDAGFRFFENAAKPATLAGSWPLKLQEEDPEPALLIIRQDGNRIEGSVQYPSGDVRYLAGEVSGDDFALSTFDGNQGSVWRGRRLPGGTLAGETFGATSKAPTKWTAEAGALQFAAVGEEKPPVDRIAFSFPDADGKPVSLADPRFAGKVVVVAIGGSWCPNCHDEAAYLSPYAKKRAGEGLEVIGLSFEYGDDPVRNARQVKRFVERYGITYPMLVAGAATPEATKAALPGIGGVKIYPTTLFIDRTGRLRAIHTGYAGPATGALNAAAVKEFDALVSKLLAEPA